LIEKSRTNGNNQLLLKGRDEASTFIMDYSLIASNATKKTNCVSVDSNLRNSILPDIEYIGHSLQKIQQITAISQMLWSNKKISGKITKDVIKIMNQVNRKNFLFCNGKSLRCPLGGLFYLLGHRYNDRKKQREIARTLQTTEVSVRIYYRKWLKDFPELFQDITEKLSNREPCGHNYYRTK
jgi:hypothetical protein